MSSRLNQSRFQMLYVACRALEKLGILPIPHGLEFLDSEQISFYHWDFLEFGSCPFSPLKFLFQGSVVWTTQYQSFDSILTISLTLTSPWHTHLSQALLPSELPTETHAGRCPGSLLPCGFLLSVCIRTSGNDNPIPRSYQERNWVQFS